LCARSWHDWVNAQALFNRPDTATTEHAAQSLGISAAIEIPIGIDDGPGSARESGEAVQLKVALENNPIRDIASDRATNVPKSSRPNLTVVVFVRGLAVIERFVSGHVNHELGSGRQVVARHDSILNEINTSLFSHVDRQVRTLNGKAVESLLENDMVRTQAFNLACPPQPHAYSSKQVGIISDEVFGEDMRRSTTGFGAKAPNFLRRAVLPYPE
jgi:hypothetical protein